MTAPTLGDRLRAALDADPHFGMADVVVTVMRVLGEQHGDLRDQIEQALCNRLREQMDLSKPGAAIRAEARADDLADAALPIVLAALAEQRRQLSAVPDEHRCESVHPDGRLRCTRVSDHVAHVNGGNGWSCACDVNTERAEQAEGTVMVAIERLANLAAELRDSGHSDIAGRVDAVLDQPEATDPPEGAPMVEPVTEGAMRLAVTATGHADASEVTVALDRLEIGRPNPCPLGLRLHRPHTWTDGGPIRDCPGITDQPEETDA